MHGISHSISAAWREGERAEMVIHLGMTVVVDEVR